MTLRQGSSLQHLRRPLIAAMVAALMVVWSLGGDVRADPAADALARMNELSRQAERSSEVMYTAQLELDAKLATQQRAEVKLAADREAAGIAVAELQRYQADVDRVAAAEYMGGPADSLSAALTVGSPQQLIETLALQRTMTAAMADTMAAYRSAQQRAAQAEADAAASLSLAQAATQAAERIANDLATKQAELRREIAAVEAQYAALTAEQRVALADPGPPPPVVAGPPPLNDPSIAAMPSIGEAQPPVAEGGGAAVVQAALTRVGAPYSWGATGPDAFDCSGLIKWSFLQQGKSLPRSSQALASGGVPVALADVQPGDIVTFYPDASHAGIYVGDGMMVHASTYGTPVKIAPISMAPINNVRRY